MTSLLYFAYGSNMSTPRLRERVPSAQPVCIARLHGHQLKFHKRGRDDSAKCDIALSHHHADVVYGVVFQILAAEKPALDRVEGLGSGYEEKAVSIINANAETINAVTYYATHIDSVLKPYHWYKEHVLRGATEHRLPAEYIEILDTIVSITDPVPARHARELAIYR